MNNGTPTHKLRYHSDTADMAITSYEDNNWSSVDLRTAKENSYYRSKREKLANQVKIQSKLFI